MSSKELKKSVSVKSSNQGAKMTTTTDQSEDKVYCMRHTLSHIMAAAVKELYPGVKFGIGPAIENGFYYDLDFSEASGDDTNPVKISDEDLPRIEKKMRGIIARNLAMTRYEKSREDAVIWAEENHQNYKKELIQDLSEDETISFYALGDLFDDLCKGPHVANTSEVGPFKLTRVAGAYWRGDEKREMLTRIYGVAFETQEELDEYMKRQEEAKARDHRKLGRELDLYCFSDLVGAGLPMFTPRGTVLRQTLGEYSMQLRHDAGFERVFTPHITKLDLYKTSGHYAKFGAELFLVHSQVNGEEFALKPMNCPHHTQIFASKPRTYREMPIRYMEPTTDYRDEKSGELGGLSRVRALTQDDSHVFCRKDQIKDEIQNLVKLVRELYSAMNMDKMRVRLSYRSDEDKYLGSPELWEMAQGEIKQAAIDNGLDYFEMEGEAAFYGPKIDFMVEDAIGREHQVATIQIDFVQPERFGLEFTNEKGEKERPVMIHHATLGSIERFMSVFIEHTAGWFPFWCAPEQVRIVTVNDQVADYVEKVKKVLDGVVLDEPLRHNELRYTVDDSDESLGKKIRRATSMKIPAVFVIGPKDAEENIVSIRLKDSEVKVKLSELSEYLKTIK